MKPTKIYPLVGVLCLMVIGFLNNYEDGAYAISTGTEEQVNQFIGILVGGGLVSKAMSSLKAVGVSRNLGVNQDEPPNGR